MPTPRTVIANLSPYTPGRSLSTVARATGLRDLIKLASNESLWGPSPYAIEAAHLAINEVSHYPEMIPSILTRHLSALWDVPEESILTGNGADEILRLAAVAYVEPGCDVIYPAPSFSAYSFATKLAGGHGVEIGLTADGAVSVQDICDQLTSATRVIYLCSPNNPTGGLVSATDWQFLLERVPEHVLIVWDAAYGEFVDTKDAFDPLPAIRAGKPILMTRTFSKIHGLAALRIGYGVAPPDIIATLAKVREPFSLNLVGAEAAAASLADGAFIHHVRSETLAARDWFAQQLRQRGLTTYPSQANFITMHVHADAERVAQALERLGFIVRPTTSFGLLEHIRVTVAPIPTLHRFLSALDEVLLEFLR